MEQVNDYEDTFYIQQDRFAQPDSQSVFHDCTG
ncbi:hypothetical protein ALFP_2649 [Alcaligenes faecalis]|nr:hypothetical protein ALFP_2649 [Alcaligenes faecalis]